MLVRSGSMRGANSYPAVISIPKDYDKAQLRLGMPGTATVFAPNAGVISIAFARYAGMPPTRYASTRHAG